MITYIVAQVVVEREIFTDWKTYLNMFIISPQATAHVYCAYIIIAYLSKLNIINNDMHRRQ